jgi:hypothetical protein
MVVLFKMFHPSTNVPRGTFCGASVEHFVESVLYIDKKEKLLYNKYNQLINIRSKNISDR